MKTSDSESRRAAPNVSVMAICHRTDRPRHNAVILPRLAAPDETLRILLHPPLPSVGVSIAMERGRQQNGSLADGYVLLIGPRARTSAVVSVSTPGVFPTAMPRLVASGTWTLLKPVPPPELKSQVTPAHAQHPGWVC